MACAASGTAPSGRGSRRDCSARSSGALRLIRYWLSLRRQRESREIPRVVIGMDPHKRSVTIEVMDGDELVLGGGRFATDIAGYRAMLDYVRAWPNRTWAIEGCSGIGRHIAHRLIADDQDVVDVPAQAVCACTGVRDWSGPQD